MTTYHFNKTIGFSIRPVYKVSPAGQVRTSLDHAGLEVGRLSQAADCELETWSDSSQLSEPYSDFIGALEAGRKWHSD